MCKAFWTWLTSSDGMFPWFEHNQGVLSVAALAIAGVALWWEFKQARNAEKEARVARDEAEAKDRKALISATLKEREGRVTSERDEITSFCFTLEQTFESLRAAARVEIHRLRAVPEGTFADSGKFIAQGLRVQRAIEAILARPPADHDSVLAACRGLEPFPSWKYLENIHQPALMIDAINGHMDVVADAQAKLREARESAVNSAQQRLAEIWAED